MKDKDIAKFYEGFHNLDNNLINKMMENARYKLLRNLLVEVRGKVLVIGCGSKDEMSIINNNCDGVGIDISQTAIMKSKEKYPRFDYYVMDGIHLEFKNSSFNVVVCSEVIEHVRDSEKLLIEIARVLKDNGILIITTPNWWGIYGVMRKIGEILFRKPLTSDNQLIDNWSTPFSLRKKLLKHFKIKKFYGFWYYPPIGKGRVRIPSVILFPFFWLLYPLDVILRRILPWFGHALVFKTVIKKV